MMAWTYSNPSLLENSWVDYTNNLEHERHNREVGMLTCTEPEMLAL